MAGPGVSHVQSTPQHQAPSTSGGGLAFRRVTVCCTDADQDPEVQRHQSGSGVDGQRAVRSRLLAARFWPSPRSGSDRTGRRVVRVLARMARKSLSADGFGRWPVQIAPGCAWRRRRAAGSRHGRSPWPPARGPPRRPGRGAQASASLGLASAVAAMSSGGSGPRAGPPASRWRCARRSPAWRRRSPGLEVAGPDRAAHRAGQIVVFSLPAASYSPAISPGSWLASPGSRAWRPWRIGGRWRWRSADHRTLAWAGSWTA
jgi:hypothetical protein